jgi:hypothetical protein
MKLASAGFLLLLFCAHGGATSDRLVSRPLSMFRDGPDALLGYAMFATLLLSGALYTAALARCRREGEAVLSGLAVLLLLAVAATPSSDAFHGLCSFLLLLLLFGFYTLLLLRCGGPWVLVHLTVPVAWMLATGFHSYGLYQKGLVVYFLLAAVVHHHVLSRQAAGAIRRLIRGQPVRRRKVYQLEPGRAWSRRRLA